MDDFLGIFFGIIFKGLLVLGAAIGMWHLWNEYHAFLIDFFTKLIG